MRPQRNWIADVVAITLFFCTASVKAQTTTDMHTWDGSQQYLTCGKHILEVTTSCAKNGDGDSYCFQQNLTFGRPDATELSQRSIEHRKNEGAEDFIAGATCVSKNKKSYFILYGTNFGNCKKGCEWMDVFTENGIYIGTTYGRYGDKSFKRMPLTMHGPIAPSEIDGLLRNVSSDSTIEIHR